MRKPMVAALSAPALLAIFAAASPGLAKETCTGREYPAKAIVVYARSAQVDVDLGFGITYRGIVELGGTKEPDTPFAEWYGKASEALRTKIGGKSILLCINEPGPKNATLFVNGENINHWMLENGYLDRQFLKENPSTSF